LIRIEFITEIKISIHFMNISYIFSNI